MTSSPTIEVHFDGEIYARQSHGGISRVFDNLLLALSRHTSVDCRLHHEPWVTPERLPSGISRAPIGRPRRWRPERVFGRWNDRRVASAEARHWGGLRDGVFHSTYYTTHPELRINQVVTIQDMTFEDYPELFPDRRRREEHVAAKKRCVFAADAIICPSRHTESRLRHWFGDDLEGRTVTVVPYGLGEALAGPRESAAPFQNGEPGPAGAPYVLHVGARHPHKNAGRLLEMFASWPRRDEIHLVCVGGGPWSSDERAFLAGRGLEGLAHAVPRATDEELASFYGRAMAVIVPSLDEGFGLPLLEALAFGKPVASSTGGALPEVGGEVPFYFSPLDVEEMAAAVDRAAHEAGAPSYARKAAGRAAEFTWRDCAVGYERVYRAVLR